MKLPTYKDALKLGKEAMTELMAPAKARSAKKKAELEMCKLDERIADAQASIQQMCTTEDVDFSKLIDKLDDMALMERRKGQYEDILNQMFPEEE
jgi:hypothetical protein